MDTPRPHDRVVLRRDERQRHSALGHPDSRYGGREVDRRPRDGLGKGKILENGKVHSMNLKVAHRAWTTSSRRGHRHRSALRTS